MPPDELAQPIEWTDEALGTFWRYISEKHQNAYFTALFGDRILDVTRRFYSREATLCDYGCGSGFLLQKILRFNRAAGIDFSRESIEATRARVAGSANLVGLYTVGELADRVPPTFDALYVVETAEHVLPRHRDRFFSNIRGLLGTGGRVIVTTPNDEDLDASTVFCPSCRHTFHRWQHVNRFDAAALASFMATGGFECVEAFSTDFAATTALQKLKSKLRPALGRKNPHLVYVGRKVG